ncbi:hypothetical protein [Kitasatospora purpeofusca]|uniref:hypothetical protein n=1 Tax=Kitasatospora purpeofusca TaxID=67352 RepID=UPI002A5A2B24|nr:hypothetical protein [Kitasatospora purpeofusca]MDY0816553.1 hypothetical protein [Kitasatospora purpeofusca]
MPSITVQVGDRKYRHLWLKYVTGIDLSRHCAVALHGRYSRLVDERTQEATVHLDEFPHALAWYLCGVTTAPYRWEDNPHLAVTAAPGHTETLNVQGLTVHLDGVKPIHFTATDNVPDDDPHANDPAYRTCRNWQFAHYLRARGVPDVHGDRPRITTLRPGAGQVELLPKPPRVKPAGGRDGGTRTNRWSRPDSSGEQPQALAVVRQLPLTVAGDEQSVRPDAGPLDR